ncbi:MAG: exo-alpha-sialidase [Luteitalea sp.]|nr:exo-alpha-sialidase [Luteitalea sp.]
MQVVLIVGTAKGAFIARSDAARRTWDIEGPIFKGWKVTSTARTPSGRYLFATASDVYGTGIHTGTDLENWRQITAAPAYPEGGDRKLNQIWTFHCGSSRHYAGVDTAGLFTSDDDGETWQPVSGLNDHPSRRGWFPGAGGLCAHVVLLHPKQPERIWCGMSAVGVWRSDDGGSTWAPKNEGVRCLAEDKEFPGIGYCVHGLVRDPDDPNTLFRQDHTGMFRTRDGGDHWERIENGLPSWFGFPIAMDDRTKTIFSFPMESDEYRLPVDGKFRVYRSRNDGDSWEELARGLPDQSYASVLRGAMAVDGLSPTGVYVGSTAGNVYTSADEGESWQPLPCTLPRILSVKAYVQES